MAAPDELPVVSFGSRREWFEWLAEHHAVSPGVWLAIARKGSGLASPTYPEALEAALCFGWIDGRKGSLDESRWLQRFTPRRARSRWSRRNCEQAETLIAAGTMAPAGLAEVERAKADGRWEAAYEPASRASVPPDLEAALAANPRAAAQFATLDGANRYAILYRLQDARKPETRARRLETFVAMLNEGKKLHP